MYYACLSHSNTWTTPSLTSQWEPPWNRLNWLHYTGHGTHPCIIDFCSTYTYTGLQHPDPSPLNIVMPALPQQWKIVIRFGVGYLQGLLLKWSRLENHLQLCYNIQLHGHNYLLQVLWTIYIQVWSTLQQFLQASDHKQWQSSSLSVVPTVSEHDRRETTPPSRNSLENTCVSNICYASPFGLHNEAWDRVE